MRMRMVWSGSRSASSLCVMFPWLFNLLMDGVMREIQETAGKIDVRLIDEKSKHEYIIE